MLINFCMVLPIMLSTDYSYFVQCPLHQKQQIIICYPLSDHLLSSYTARKAPQCAHWKLVCTHSYSSKQFPDLYTCSFIDHIWKPLRNELSFQIKFPNCVYILVMHTMQPYTLYTNLILWKLHTICIPCVYHVIYSQLPFIHLQLPQNFV